MHAPCSCGRTAAEVVRRAGVATVAAATPRTLERERARQLAVPGGRLPSPLLQAGSPETTDASKPGLPDGACLLEPHACLWEAESRPEMAAPDIVECTARALPSSSRFGHPLLLRRTPEKMEGSFTSLARQACFPFPHLTCT